MRQSTISLMEQFSQRASLSAEDLGQVVPVKEVEVVWYGEIDEDIISRLRPAYYQEQYEVYLYSRVKGSKENVKAGRERIRYEKNFSTGAETYVRTIKLPYGRTGDSSAQVMSNMEHNYPSNLQEYEVFKKVAGVGMHKYRYRIKHPDGQHVFEVDAFKDPAGSGRLVKIVKVDLEIQAGASVSTEPPKWLKNVFNNLTDPDKVTKIYDELFMF